MADSMNSTLVPRRALLAGAAGLTAVPFCSKPVKSDPAFAEKLAAFKDARKATEMAHSRIDEALNDLGPRPAANGQEWMEKVKEIEAGSAPYIHAEDAAAIAVIRHPVFTLEEVRAKIKVAQDAYLFDHDDVAEFMGSILKDALTIAETAHV